MSSDIIQLPVIETIKRSFSYVWHNPKVAISALALALVLLIAQIIIRVSPDCSANLTACSESWQIWLLSLLFSLTNMAIIINYCRKVCGHKTDFSSLKFIKRIVIYIGAMLVISIIAILFLALVIGITSIFTQDELIVQANLYISAIIIGILAAPLMLCFPGIAMDDYEFLSIQRLFRVAKGNHNAIFWGLMAISLIIFSPMLILVISTALISGLDSLRNNLWLLTSSMVFQLIYSALKGAYYAHLYQFFKYVEKK